MPKMLVPLYGLEKGRVYYMGHAPVNDPARAGQYADRRVIFGDWHRYSVVPVHTRFGAVQWFTFDTHSYDPLDDTSAIIRQVATFEEAVAGLC